MEEKIIIIVNNQKSFETKNKLNLEEIKKFIKEEYNLQKECFIEIFSNDLSKMIIYDKDLEKLKEKNEKFNKYIIRINYKLKDDKQHYSTVFRPSLNKNIITNQSNNYKEIAELKKSLKKEISNSDEEIEDNKLNEKIKIIQQKQEKEIESLEKELKELKRMNEDLSIDIENDNNGKNILINNSAIENLKKSIINEINSKINKELKTKMEEIDVNKLNKQNENYINKQIEKKVEETIKQITSSFNEIMKKQQELDNKFKNINNININNNKKEFYEENNEIINNISSKKLTKQKNSNNKKREEIFNIQPLNKNKIDANNNSDEENIKDDGDNNQNKLDNKINNIKINKQYQNLNDRNVKNNKMEQKYKYFDGLKKDKPNLLINNKNLEQYQKPIKQKNKPKTLDLLVFLNSIFFKNKEQTEIKSQKMNEYYKELLKKEYYKFIEEKNNKVAFYAISFIKSNVLKIFKETNISKDTLDIVKYNIETILECIGTDKNLFSDAYQPDSKREKKGSRQNSVKAARKFRDEFGVKQEDLNEKVLVDLLNKNNDDINLVFQLIYGK